MRLALIGPRCSGKSTVARLLAKRLHCPVASTDKLVESLAQQPISKIVEGKGWKAFREYETQCLQSIVDESASGLILDCGGGIIESATNRQIIIRLDKVIFLNGDPRVLVARLQRDSEGRPALTENSDELEEMKLVLSRRLPLYRQTADLEVDGTDLSPDEVAEKICVSFNL